MLLFNLTLFLDCFNVHVSTCTFSCYVGCHAASSSGSEQTVSTAAAPRQKKSAEPSSAPAVGAGGKGEKGEKGDGYKYGTLSRVRKFKVDDTVIESTTKRIVDMKENRTLRDNKKYQEMRWACQHVVLAATFVHACTCCIHVYMYMW